MRNSFFLIYIFLIFTAYTNAWAELPSVSIKGFGSAGAARADHPSYFLSDFGTSGKAINLTQNTLLGINLASKIGDRWSLAAQFVSAQGQTGYVPNLDWGFLSYQPIPEFSVRVGRVVAPTWLFSQQLKVGYSYIWVRPPVEVYSLLPGITSLNGISFLSQLQLAGGTLSTDLYGGADDHQSYTNNPSSPAVFPFRIKDMVGIDLTYNYRDFVTLHASYLQSHNNVKAQYVLAPTTVVPLSLEFGQFASAGATLEYKNFLFIGEFARRLIRGQALQAASAWYGTIGYRLGNLVPHFTYSWLGGLRGSYYLHPDSNILTTTKKRQYSYTLGIMANLNDSVNVKAEYQPVKYEFLDGTKDFSAKILSSTINFIF